MNATDTESKAQQSGNTGGSTLMGIRRSILTHAVDGCEMPSDLTRHWENSI